METNTYQINDEQIQEIRESVDIVDIISSYLPLTGKGKNFFGVCPFHDDHSPSMSVSREKQIYRCFSCGASGNVFKFIMDYENLGFLEALKIVADKGGIPIAIGNTKKKSSKQQYYYDIYEIAFKFYQNNINTTLGKEAKQYLNQRKISNETIKKFGIGLSLKNTELLTKLLLKKGFTKEQMIKSGLVSENEKGLHDVYYNRILFPLWDLTGKIVGFSGRIYQSEDSAKYINTKETEIFKKGELLYHYHDAKDSARQKGQVIIMEGFMDVIRASIVGIENVVATMGTAVTKEQALLIKRMAKEVILCFDGDDAGAKATMLCANELLEVGVTPKVIRLEENLDPDEYIQKYGKEQMMRKLENTIPIMDFKLGYLKEKKDLNNNQDTSLYVKEVLNEITKMDDVILRELTLKKLSDETHLEIDFLKNQLQEPETPITVPKTKSSKIQNKYQKAEQNLLYYMLNSAEVVQFYMKHISYMPTKKYRSLAREIDYFYHKYGRINLADMLTFLREDEENTKTIQELLALSLKEEYTISEIMDYIHIIQEFGIEQECERLKQMINLEIDPMKQAEIAKKIIELKKKETR